jgi:hypothetical protein
MKLNDVAELYYLISKGTENLDVRSKGIAFRKKALEAIKNNVLSTYSSDKSNDLVKVAFDTRRIDQETVYIPRRGLQNYHRSEAFVSDDMNLKIKAFKRLADILNQLKQEFGKQAAWQDSYTRVLYSSVHSGLRTSINDGDFSDTQPSMGSINYLEELLYVRYRLTPDNLLTMASDDLRKLILNKDELLVNSEADPFVPFTKEDISKHSYDELFNKMMTTMAAVMSNYKTAPAQEKTYEVDATKDNKSPEKTVTIKITL